MDDNAILDLYFARSEQAISETDRKYGHYCYSIANHTEQNRYTTIFNPARTRRGIHNTKASMEMMERHLMERLSVRKPVHTNKYLLTSSLQVRELLNK